MSRRAQSSLYGAPELPSTYVSRGRVSSRLESSAPLLIVRAPAGSGKTVVMAEWAAGTRTGGVWITVGQENATRKAFWRSVAAAMSAAGLAPRGSIMARVRDALLAHQDVRSLIQRAFAELEGEVVLVVDDLDLLETDAQDDIAALVEAVPSTRVIAASRARTALEHTASAESIESGDLLFTAAETAEMLDAQAPARSEAVHRATGGHAIAIRAMILLLAHAGPRAGTSEIDLLAGIRVLGDDFFGFAIRTSAAEVLTVELAAELSGLGSDDAGRMLVLAEACGLGLRAVTADGELFTYTGRVLELLRAQRPPDEGSDVMRAVARWSHLHGRPMTALRDAVGIADYALAETIVRAWWITLLSTHAQALRDTLSRLKLSTLRKLPLMSMVLGLSYNALGTHRVKAVEMFGLSIVSSRTRRDQSPPDLAALRTMESAALRVIGRHHQAALVARAASKIVDGLTESQRDEIASMLPQLYTHSGISFLMAGESELALERFERGIASGDAIDPIRALHPLALAAGTRALLGDMPEARALLAEAASRDWPDGWIAGYTGALYQVAAAVDALEAGDPERADGYLRTMDRHLQTIEHWPAIAGAQAAADLMAGEAERGLERLRSTVRWHMGRPGAGDARPSRVSHAEAMLHLALGHPAAAITAVRAAKVNPMTSLDLARIALSTGDPDGAVRHLAAVPDAASPSTRFRAGRGVLEVALMLRRGAEDDASLAIGPMLALLADRQLRTPLMLIPERDFRAIAVFAERVAPDAAWVLDDVPIAHPIKALRAVPVLSERERAVLGELRHHSRTADLAAALFISPNTVKSHLRGVYRKLGVSTRDDALVAAHAMHLFDAAEK